MVQDPGVVGENIASLIKDNVTPDALDLSISSVLAHSFTHNNTTHTSDLSTPTDTA